MLLIFSAGFGIRDSGRIHPEFGGDVSAWRGEAGEVVVAKLEFVAG
jgi:hypothetical protein